MSEGPLMPKATAVWLVENTTMSFKQIADFCNLHELEVKGIADGDVAKGIKAYNPILAGQLTREEIEASSNDSSRPLQLRQKNLDIDSTKQRKTKYIPLSKRQDRPNAILWLIKNYPQLSDGQVGKLIGSTIGTISLIRNRSYWNFSNLAPKDPVASDLCSQLDLQKAVDKANRKVEREKKKAGKEKSSKESQ